jgi:hypothetical protein
MTKFEAAARKASKSRGFLDPPNTPEMWQNADYSSKRTTRHLALLAFRPDHSAHGKDKQISR